MACCIRLEIFAAAIFWLLALSAPAASYSIAVNIAEQVQSDVKLVRQSAENNFLSLDYDIFNSGSVEYAARLRLDISNDTLGMQVPLATIWSREVPLQPGERKSVGLYWYGGNAKGNLTARVRAYRAQEIEDVNIFAFALPGASGSESAFSVEKVRVSDSSIRIYLRASEDINDAIIYPAKFPGGWLFEEEDAGSFRKNQKKWITIYYEPAIFAERDITLAVVGDAGKYYSEKTIRLKKEGGVLKYLNAFWDSLT